MMWNQTDADARAPIEEVEPLMRCDFLPENRDKYIDAIGGDVASRTGRVPQRKKTTTQQSGIEFEITESGARRVKWLRLHRVKPVSEVE